MDLNEKIKALHNASNLQAVLENKLKASDYKVIKCYEYSLVGIELPYDINELHAERELIREEIRALEDKFAE
jgi:hypothetical protein